MFLFRFILFLFFQFKPDEICVFPLFAKWLEKLKWNTRKKWSNENPIGTRNDIQCVSTTTMSRPVHTSQWDYGRDIIQRIQNDDTEIERKKQNLERT